MEEDGTGLTRMQADCVRTLFAQSIELKRKVMQEHYEPIAEMAGICIDAYSRGGKLLLCGNGGSASDDQHLAAEMLVRLRPHVNRPGLPALSLSLDPSSLTACGDDYSYELYFERMTLALGKPGDVLVGITTSGKSINVIRALRAGRGIGLGTLGFLGDNGGAALEYCDAALVVSSTETGRIQEVHITVGHALMELIEDGLIAEGKLERLD